MSQKFINKVSDISEGGHHPDIMFGWGYATINITTHAIEVMNDFILAAKIDNIFMSKMSEKTNAVPVSFANLIISLSLLNLRAEL